MVFQMFYFLFVNYDFVSTGFLGRKNAWKLPSYLVHTQQTYHHAVLIARLITGSRLLGENPAEYTGSLREYQSLICFQLTVGFSSTDLENDMFAVKVLQHNVSGTLDTLTYC